MNLRKLIVVIMISMPAQSFAWGLLGHRIVGQIADSYLTPQAKLAVMKILGTESIAMASNWPDFIKSDSSYNYLYNWHYINIKAGYTHEQVDSVLAIDTASNAYTRINQIVKQLKGKDISAVERALYLKLLIHIVGDIHQPLHVGRPEDLGGNRIKVLWFNVSYNLHQVWDQLLIQLQELSYTEYATAINHTTAAQRLVWQKQPVKEWIWESYQLAEKVYGDIKTPEDKLGYNYNFRYKAILEEQMLKGGVRLAGLLNDIFGQNNSAKPVKK